MSKELLDALMAHYLHQNELLWSRVQLLILLQSGVLVGSFSQKDNLVGPIILISGGILTFLINFLVLRDEEDRDLNIELIDFIDSELVPNGFKEEIK